MQTTTQCIQHISTDNGTARCSRKGTHLIPSGDRMVCTQHARSYDVKVSR
jgi:hypothetical protein